MKDASRKNRMPKPRKPDHPSIPALEWFRDVSGRAARITAIDNRHVLIENHTGIQDFSDEHISLRTLSGRLQIQGQNLTLSEVRESALIVRGLIRQINLPGEEAAQ